MITEFSMQSKHLSACYHVACDGMRVIYNHIHKALNASLNCLNFSSVLSHSVINSVCNHTCTEMDTQFICSDKELCGITSLSRLTT